MKILLNYCTQVGRYRHSEGKCVIELETGDDANAIIADYTKPREWWEQKYSNPQRINKYEHKRYDKSVQVLEGDLLVFNTYQAYLD